MNIPTHGDLPVLRHIDVDQTLILFKDVSALEDDHGRVLPVEELLALHVLHHLNYELGIQVLIGVKSWSRVGIFYNNILNINSDLLIVHLNAFPELSLSVLFEGKLVLIPGVLIGREQLANHLEVLDGVDELA